MIAPQPAKTSVKVPMSSATSRRSRARLTPRIPCRTRASVAGGCVARDQLADQLADPDVELVADSPYGGEVLAGRVVELPVGILLARVDRARIAAPHRDHHVGGTNDFVGERLGELLA